MIIAPPDVAGTTTAAGSGPFVISGPIAVPGGGGNYRQWSTVANGARVHVIRQDTGGANFERGIADVANVAGVVTLTWNPREETSAGGAVAVSWSGTQNVWTISGSMIPRNAGAEYAGFEALFRANLGLLENRVTISQGQSGGTIGKFVRLSAANTWVDASQGDTIDQLALVAFKESSTVYVFSGRIAISSLTAALPYYLSTAGGLTSTAPTPSSTVRRRTLGISLSTTEFLMAQYLTVGGA